MDKWGIIFGSVGVLAFLLAIPMSIVANILTPKLRDWWASTSRARGLKRYRYLGREINKHEKSEDFEELAQFASMLTAALGFGIFCLFALALFDSLNTIYIAVKNGQRVEDSSMTLEQIHFLGYLLAGVVGISSVGFQVFGSSALRHARFISALNRRRHIERLVVKRKQLATSLGIVDNNPQA
jgi:MFS family permease